MRNKHVTRFGDPTTASGALYFVTDQEGLVQMATELELAKRYKEGRTITDRQKEHVEKRVRRLQSKYNKSISGEGVSENLSTLLEISKKAEAEKYCKTLLISEHDLFLLIHNCVQIGFKHRSRFPQYVPSHGEIQPEDKEKMKNGDFKQITKKVNAIFTQRRNIYVHIFERGVEWHCFYFSLGDIDVGEKNHWIQGCHIHYLSHLWPNYNKEQVWNIF